MELSVGITLQYVNDCTTLQIHWILRLFLLLIFNCRRLNIIKNIIKYN